MGGTMPLKGSQSARLSTNRTRSSFASLSRRTLATSALALSLLAGIQQLSAQTVASTPVGAFSYPITPGSAGSPSLNFIGFPLLAPSAASGSVVAASGSSVTLPSGALSGVTLTGPHFLLIQSGTFQGLALDVTSVSGDTVNVSGSVAGIVAAGDSFSIRPHRTLASLFGATNTAGLIGANTIATADEVRVFNSSTQSFTNYYYKTGGIGGAGWRSTQSTSLDRSSDIVDPEQSIVVVRKSNAALSLTVTGEVYAKRFRLPAEAGANWVINTAAKELTLGTLGLYTGGADGLTGANTINGADEVLRWTGSAWERFYYKTGGLGGQGWRSNASTSVDRGGQVIGAGEVLVINRKSGAVLLTRNEFTIAP